MKKLIIVILAAYLSACTTKTEYGNCKGLFTENEKSQNLRYEADIGNVVIGVLLSETIAITIITFGFFLWCPTGKNNEIPNRTGSQ